MSCFPVGTQYVLDSGVNQEKEQVYRAAGLYPLMDAFHGGVLVPDAFQCIIYTKLGFPSCWLYEQYSVSPTLPNIVPCLPVMEN